MGSNEKSMPLYFGCKLSPCWNHETVLNLPHHRVCTKRRFLIGTVLTFRCSANVLCYLTKEARSAADGNDHLKKSTFRRMSLSCSNDISNQSGMKEDKMKKAGPPKQSVYCGSAAVGEGEAVAAAAPADLRQDGSNGENSLMKRTLVAQSRKIQQLTAKIDAMETERETLRQEIDALRMTVFEASTRAEHTAEQCKQSAVDAAVREIARDREAFAEGRREALRRIAELEDALEIALRAAGGVHKRLLELGLSCEDLGKTSVHLSVAAKEAPAQDKPALAVAGETIEAVVGVMRAMEGSGVFDILDPLEDEVEEDVGTLEAAAATEAESTQQPGDTSNVSPSLPERKISTVDTPAKRGSGVPTAGLGNVDGVERGSVINPQEEDVASAPGKQGGRAALKGGVFNEGRTGYGEPRGVSEESDHTKNALLDSRRA